MSRVDLFKQELCRIIEDESHGYSQTNRWGPDYDCSSLMIHCAHVAGYDVDEGWGNTGTMRASFEAAGWRVVEYGSQDLWGIPGGCIMLQCACHTEGVIDFGQWGGAHIDEHGGVTGCCEGDQAGNEISYCNPYHYANYPDDWDYVLVPPEVDYEGLGAIETDDADSGTSLPFDRSDGQTGSGICYEVHTKAGWLGHVTKCDDSDDGYAGYNDQPIDGIRAYRMDGEPLRIQTLMDDGSEWSWTEFVGSLRGSNEENDGYAGDIDSGHHIIGLRVEGAQVRVAVAGQPWLGWETYGEMTDEGDDFAGEDLEKGLKIVAVQIKV